MGVLTVGFTRRQSGGAEPATKKHGVGALASSARRLRHGGRKLGVGMDVGDGVGSHSAFYRFGGGEEQTVAEGERWSVEWRLTRRFWG
jgi:hypothetical protein